MGYPGTDHAKTADCAAMIAWHVLLCRVLHVLRFISQMMARHFCRLHLHHAGQCVLSQCHLHGHDIGCHDKAWEPAHQEQAQTFTHIGLR